MEADNKDVSLTGSDLLAGVGNAGGFGVGHDLYSGFDGEAAGAINCQGFAAGDPGGVDVREGVGKSKDVATGVVKQGNDEHESLHWRAHLTEPIINN